MLFKSKIDRLEQKQKELEASIESEKSSIAYENSRIEAKIKKLEEKVEKHNNFATRLPVVEEQIKVINHRLEDLENER